MNRPMAIVAGVLAGLLGAAIWGAVVYYGEIEIGIIAWGIGALVGVAMVSVAGQSSAEMGVIAAVIAALSICGGKYVGIQLIFDDAFSGDVAWEQLYEDEDSLIAAHADKLVEEAAERDEELEWPEIDYESDEEVDLADTYPPGIWREAEDKWAAMNAEEREAFKHEQIASMRELQDNLAGAFSSFAFKESFGLFDVLFFGLGVFTAFKIAGTEWE